MMRRRRAFDIDELYKTTSYSLMRDGIWEREARS